MQVVVADLPADERFHREADEADTVASIQIRFALGQVGLAGCRWAEAIGRGIFAWRGTTRRRSLSTRCVGERAVQPDQEMARHAAVW